MMNEALDQFSVEWRPLAGLAPYGKNARVHGEEQIERLAASLREFGWMRPLLITAAGEVIAGHGAMQAALRLGLAEAPCAIRDHLTPEQVKAYRLADNQLALLAGWDNQLLGRELRDLADAGYDIGLTGFGLADIDEILRPPADISGAGLSDSLAEPFLAPAITTFDARQGWWQDRKRAWIALGIQSELGRGAAPGGSPLPLVASTESELDGPRYEKRARKRNAAPGGSPRPAAKTVKGKTVRGDGRGRRLGA